MAVYSLVANSLMPVGGMLLGFIAEHTNPLLTIRMAAMVSLVIAAGLFVWSQTDRHPQTR
jgi:hypothetical protein